MGNSEVGHLNIGAGRIVHMDITRIDLLIANKQLDQVPLFQQAMERGRQRQLHFLGLLSDGGVHSHIKHLFALLEWPSATRSNTSSFTASWTAATPRPTAAAISSASCSRKCANSASATSPRSSAATTPWTATTAGSASSSPIAPSSTAKPKSRTDDPVDALQRSYEQGVTDEFVKPIVITNGAGAAAPPVGLIRDDDAVIFFNFRADRARQMTFALAEPDFDKFADPERPKNLFYVGMTQYDKSCPWLKYVLSPEKLEHILAQVFAGLQYKNLRWPKPKNTPTSPTSSMAAWKNRSPAKNASSCPRRKSPPTI